FPPGDAGGDPARGGKGGGARRHRPVRERGKAGPARRGGQPGAAQAVPLRPRAAVAVYKAPPRRSGRGRHRMNVNELLDTIEDTLAESANMPLSGGKRIVDVDQIQEYLDEIRANLPGELRQAQAIVNDRGQIVDSANAQAKAIIRQAEERARVLVSESEIVKSAQQRAAEIMAQAQAESRTLRQTTADYCDNMLKTT